MSSRLHISTLPLFRSLRFASSIFWRNIWIEVCARQFLITTHGCHTFLLIVMSTLVVLLWSSARLPLMTMNLARQFQILCVRQHHRPKRKVPINTFNAVHRLHLEPPRRRSLITWTCRVCALEDSRHVTTSVIVPLVWQTAIALVRVSLKKWTLFIDSGLSSCATTSSPEYTESSVVMPLRMLTQVIGMALSACSDSIPTVSNVGSSGLCTKTFRYVCFNNKIFINLFAMWYCHLTDL